MIHHSRLHTKIGDEPDFDHVESEIKRVHRYGEIIHHEGKLTRYDVNLFTCTYMYFRF